MTIELVPQGKYPMHSDRHRRRRHSQVWQNIKG